jgi:hypothetical protein
MKHLQIHPRIFTASGMDDDESVEETDFKIDKRQSINDEFRLSSFSVIGLIIKFKLLFYYSFCLIVEFNCLIV